MSKAALKELGRRLGQRRREAKLDVPALAHAARVLPASIETFETGGGGLGASELVRIAQALRIPEGSFLHTDAEPVAAQREPSFMLSEVAQAADLSSKDRAALTTQLHRARAFADLGSILGCPDLAAKFTPRPVKGTPYSAGYDLARAVRGKLGVPTAPLRDLRRSIEDQFNILVVCHRFDDARVQAASCRSGRARLIALSPSLSFEGARRITLAHELGHHLADLPEEGIITDQEEDRADDGYSVERSPPEKRAKAFAVMFIAPQPAIRALLGSKKIAFSSARDEITSLRETFGIGFAAMAWHLFHLRLLDCSEDAVHGLVSSGGDNRDITGFEPANPVDGLERRIEEALARNVISEQRARILARNDARAA